jgi:hypothetical protein
LAEIGYDPAGGLAVHEATSLVQQQIPLVPTAATFLLQPSVFGSNRAHLTLDRKGPNLVHLRDYLLRFFPVDHDCLFVRSALVVTAKPNIAHVKLKDLASVPHRTIAGSTLFLPPLEKEGKHTTSRSRRG